MRKLTTIEAQGMCELLEERSICKSTVFTTQLPLAHWYEGIGDPVIADTIRDRMEHSALRISITEKATGVPKSASLQPRRKRVIICLTVPACDPCKVGLKLEMLQSGDPRLPDGAGCAILN